MAAIDRLYGTQAQYDEFRAWCYEQRKSLLRFFRPRHWGTAAGMDTRSICAMPVWADKWLYTHCPLEWVRAGIEEQYGGDPNVVAAGQPGRIPTRWPAPRLSPREWRRREIMDRRRGQ